MAAVKSLKAKTKERITSAGYMAGKERGKAGRTGTAGRARLHIGKEHVVYESNIKIRGKRHEDGR